MYIVYPANDSQEISSSLKNEKKKQKKNKKKTYT